MPAAAQKKSARSLSTPKPGYDPAKGRNVSLLLKQKMNAEREAGLVLMVPDGVHRLPIPAAAAKFDLKPGTLRKWICEGRLKYVRFGRQLRVTEADILAAASAIGEVA